MAITTVSELAQSVSLSTTSLALLAVFGVIFGFYVIYCGVRYVLLAVAGVSIGGERDSRYWSQDDDGNWFRN